MSDIVEYSERVVIPLPNGDRIPALVEVRKEDDQHWTRITPDVAVVVPAAGIADELGDQCDLIHDMESRGVESPQAMVRLFVQTWERDYA
jgi:hypothetical protein